MNIFHTKTESDFGRASHTRRNRYFLRVLTAELPQSQCSIRPATTKKSTARTRNGQNQKLNRTSASTSYGTKAKYLKAKESWLAKLKIPMTKSTDFSLIQKSYFASFRCAREETLSYVFPRRQWRSRMRKFFIPHHLNLTSDVNQP